MQNLNKKMVIKHTILIIDDKKENLKYLSTILETSYNIRATTDPSMVLDFLQKFTPDLILLDINMPEIDGYTLCRQIKSINIFQDIPIIFISSYEDIDHKVLAFENGGVDYITKPFEPREVEARVATQIEVAKSKKTISELLYQQNMFIKKIMHEMNTPLSIISLNADSIERKKGMMDEIDTIKASSKTLSSIYDDLSYLIKNESKEYQINSIDLERFLSMRTMFFDEMAKQKDLSFELNILEHFHININEYEFKRVIDNTISNSIKYSYPSSIIAITMYEKEKQYFVAVTNDGEEINDTDTIFTPYYQQSTKNLGLGLGLTIVKEICDKYNIKITIESKNNQTTFIYDITQLVGEP
jgi:DNA-binding response OmpR family regulator